MMLYCDLALAKQGVFGDNGPLSFRGSKIPELPQHPLFWN